jgi:ATP-binding cassette subfamily B protein/subfamily B ATP-binding cassette protein MsbA
MIRTSELRRYWPLVAPFRWTIVLLFVLALISASIMIVQPYLYHYAIDEIALRQDVPVGVRVRWLGYVLAVMMTFVGLSFLTNYYNAYKSASLNYLVTARLRHKLLRHMLTLPLHALVTMKTGGAVARLNQDTATVSQIISRALIAPGVAVLQVIVALAMVFTLNWRLSLAAMVIIVPIGVASHRLAKRLRPLFAEIGRLNNELSARSTELFGGVRVARIYRREAAERRGYMRMYHQVIRKTLEVRQRQMAIDSFTGVSFGLIQVVIVSLGVYLIIHGQATVGDIFAIVIYCNRIMGPVDQVIHAYQQLQEDFAAMDRLFEVLDMPPDTVERPDTYAAPGKVEGVTFQNVGFSYNGTKHKALSGIDLHIPGGRTVALVGRSGAGKSTFTDLLSRFYEPQEGAIYLNGRDVREIDLKSYRSLLGMVQQDTFLFDGTVRENIAYAVPRASDAQIVAAATRANAHEFIAPLPNGYDTVIGERGVKLSGGQRQRISMARAFLVDPEILILDEATSNLDTENEQVIQAAMKELFRNRTTFIIAHRLSTVTHADTIIVLDSGRIREVGTHDELTAQRGLYFEMIQRQQQVDRIGL